MKVLRLLALSLSIACGASATTTTLPTPAPEPAEEPAISVAAAFVEPLLDGRRANGVSVATRRGDVREEHGFGLPEGARLEIGSATKLYTALLLALLQEQGDLQPDATIGEVYRGSVALPDAVRRIRLEALATHTSGLPPMPEAFQPADPLDPYATFDEAWLFRALAGASIESAPAFAYSNFGAAVLGQLLAMVGGESYEEMVTGLILTPLQMHDTGFSHEGLSQGHTAYGAEGGPWDFRAFAPAGALVSTAADQLRFLEAQLHPPDSPLGRAMRRTHAPRAQVAESVDIGLGWMQSDGLHWHNGQTLSFHSFIAFDSEHDVAVVLLADTASMEVDEASTKLAQRLRGDEVTPPDFRTPVVAPALLARYQGEYLLAEGFTLTLRVEGGQLFVQATGQPPYPLYATGVAHEFELRVAPARALFEMTEEGPAAAVTWLQGGQSTRAPRIASPAAADDR